jgi:hypothetical protein
MTKRQEYLDLQKKHQKELEEFPIAYAFNEKQLEEALKKLGATREECVTVFNHGDIVRREDAKALVKLLEDQREEMLQRIKDDPIFAEAAFLYEMDNHEYAINWTGDEDVLACFGITFEHINQWNLQYAWGMAKHKHMEHAEKWGMI